MFILGLLLSGIKCMQNVMEPSPLATSDTFSSSQRETLNPLDSNPSSQLLSPW